jgi:hypothetical protein
MELSVRAVRFVVILRAVYHTLIDTQFQRVARWNCQRKVEYFARTPTSYFAAIDFPRLFRIDPSGSTATSSIQNLPLTMASQVAKAPGKVNVRNADILRP